MGVCEADVLILPESHRYYARVLRPSATIGSCSAGRGVREHHLASTWLLEPVFMYRSAHARRAAKRDDAPALHLRVRFPAIVRKPS